MSRLIYLENIVFAFIWEKSHFGVENVYMKSLRFPSTHTDKQRGIYLFYFIYFSKEAETGLLWMWAELSCFLSSGDRYVGQEKQSEFSTSYLLATLYPHIFTHRNFLESHGVGMIPFNRLGNAAHKILVTSPGYKACKWYL